MTLNYIWIGFFLIAFVVAVAKLIFLGDTEVFPQIVSSVFDMSKTGFDISLGSIGELYRQRGVTTRYIKLKRCYRWCRSTGCQKHNNAQEYRNRDKDQEFEQITRGSRIHVCFGTIFHYLPPKTTKRVLQTTALRGIRSTLPNTGHN